MAGENIIYDGVVATDGTGDFRTLQAADDALDGGAYSLYIKNGTYDLAGAQFTAASTQYLDIADNTSVTVTGSDFTFATWVFLDTTATQQGLISKWNGNTDNREYLLEYFQTSDRFEFFINSDGESGASNANVVADNFGSPATGTWHFIMIEHDTAADTISISVNNGTADSTSTTKTVFDGVAPFELGSLTNSSGTRLPLDGRLDSVGFWKRTLTTSEKTWLYNSGTNRVFDELGTGDGLNLKTTLVSWWDLDEDILTTANDSQGSNNLDGTGHAPTRTSGVNGTFEVSTNSVKLEFEPGTVIEGGITFSGDNIECLFGSGSDTQGLLTVSGTSVCVECENGVDFDGLLVSGNNAYFDGGGWDTLSDGGATRLGVNIASTDDCIVKNTAVTATSGGGFDAINLNGTSLRNSLINIKILDAGDKGIELNNLCSDTLMQGIYIVQCDDSGITCGSERNRIIGCHVASAGGDGISLGSGDNSIITGCVIEACTGDEIKILSAGENCVVVGNRVFGVINDDSGTSTVELNDLGTATCTVTGTFQSTTTNESDIVSGGKTLILTLANAAWQNIPAATLATNFQALLTGDHSEANDWDNEKSTILASGTVVRTSDTVITITLAAAASYSITTTNEIVTLANLTNDVLASESSITPDDTSYTIVEGS